MTDTLTILTAARNIIADPDMWYQGDDYTASGEWDTDEPCCAMCAIWRAEKANGDLGCKALWHIRNFVPERANLVDFNDAYSTAHADVMAVFDRAIAALEDK